MRFSVRTFHLKATFLALALLCHGRAADSNDWPDWLRAVVGLPTPENAKSAPALVLLDDTSLDVDAKGVATEVHRMAVRILHISGREYAAGGVGYIGNADKVLGADAWLCRNGKSPRPIKAADWVDLASNSPGAVIDEYRSRRISLTNDALANDVFACETRLRRPLLLAQLRWNFGSHLPVLTERLTLRLPAGFSVEPKIFGENPPLASTDGEQGWTWTASDRPFRPNEPFTARTARVDSELCLKLIPPAGITTFAPRSFSNWPDVAAMYDSLNRGQCDSSPDLVAKVRELTARPPDLLGKIAALGAYVQRLRYIEINQGLRFGFGWKARKASQVFANGYGDCKDKANLLVAMLREAGISAHPVLAMMDPELGFVAHPECPSPAQFNHAIVGIEVDEAVPLSSAVATEKSGRILFFDPTDPYTQVGDLPYFLQGTKVYLVTPASAQLIELPQFEAKDDFLVEREVTLNLATGGAITAAGRIRSSRQAAAEMRHDVAAANLPKQLDQLVADQLSDAFRSAVVQERKTDDDIAAHRCTLTFSCEYPRFVQRLPGNSAIVKLDILSRRYRPNFSDNERTQPIELRPAMLRDKVVLTLPEGFKPEELPANVSLESPYGTYQTSFEITPAALIMNRTVTFNRVIVPATDYAKVRKFFSDISRADRNSVLLKPAT